MSEILGEITRCFVGGPGHYPDSRDAETRDRPMCGLRHGLASYGFCFFVNPPPSPDNHQYMYMYVCVGTVGCNLSLTGIKELEGHSNHR